MQASDQIMASSQTGGNPLIILNNGGVVFKTVMRHPASIEANIL